MPQRCITHLGWITAAIIGAGIALPAAADDEADGRQYLDHIKPILQAHCYSCHGPLKQKSGLRVDTGQLMRAGGFSGPAVTPGEPEKSVLIDALLGRNDVERMPHKAEPLKDAEIDAIRKWIAGGAKTPADETPAKNPSEHWAFQSPTRPALPDIKQEDWPINPIDRFIAAQHEAHNVAPQPDAARHTLLRRIHLDLVGLPPTPAQLDAFVNDTSPGAYERVVDELLASKHFGERWGRHWMDVWRYSDWYGYNNELRNSARHIWRWRDWIVESLNANKPYDEMIIEMLAADEAKPLNRDALRATGFLVRNYYKFNRHVWLEQTIEHTGKAFLGVTLNCAKCHDHMYDPISQQAYYEFRAIFEPYGVRTERVPGQPDVNADGLPRAFDETLDARTFVFERGNDKQPRKDAPVSPGVPAAVADVPFEVSAVELPAEAYYPGLREFVRNEELTRAKQIVVNAEELLAAMHDSEKKLDKELNEAKQALATAREAGDAESIESALAHYEKLLVERDLAGLRVSTQQQDLAHRKAALKAVEARLAADAARYADPPAPNADSLARVAAQKARYAKLLAASAKSAEALIDIRKAEAEKEGGARKKALDVATKKAEAAAKHVQQAIEELKKQDDNYPPLTPLLPTTSTGRRLALAKWITDRRNPLTARVAVNHIWMRHFGQPLVASVFDFGMNGTEPTHPKLLDFLAVELMEHDWNLKHIHRLIVTSRTYRMRSTTGGAAQSASMSDNRYYTRMNPRRLEGEVVRDALLSVAGKLDTTMGGPELDHNAGMTSHRRSLYFRHAMEKQMQFLALFDAASPNECYRRAKTIVPQQALALANSPLALDMSRELAATLSKESKDDAAFVRALFMRVLCREPNEQETAACLAFLNEQTETLKSGPGDPHDAGASPKTSPSADPQQRAREGLVHVLFNHHEFVTVR